MRKFLLCSFFTFLFLIMVQAQETHIYIVRHGEKNMSDADKRNPNLSEEGLQRATRLAKVLKDIKFTAVYASDYKRTIQTGTPTAEKNQLKITTYNPRDFQFLVQDVLTHYSDQNVLIVGHSNTILEIVESFGGVRPVPEVPEEEFGNIFHLVLTKEGTKVFHMEY